MLTYGDMTTLLLVFFVALFKLGDAVSDAKSMSALMSFRSGVGVMEGSISVLRPDEVLLMPQTPGDAAGALFNPDEKLGLEAIKKAMADLENMEGKGRSVWTLNEGGLKVRLDSKALFGLGDAAVREDAKPELDRIAKLAKEFNLEVTVEGHTDNRPISTPEFRSNWELSAARAIRVMKYMEDAESLDPKYFTAIGKGEQDPECDVAADPSEECYQANRRVEILLKRTNDTPENITEEDIKKITGQSALEEE
jgi:chemotaxis protein MotB